MIKLVNFNFILKCSMILNDFFLSNHMYHLPESIIFELDRIIMYNKVFFSSI